jgi:LmbE family N-acetylglucosaminyl deacetylase
VSPFDDELYVTKGLRVIIFSPHPDDESLAAAGLMHRVVSNGGEVRVVFVTNGDGYPEAVRRQLGHPPRSSDDFIDYGRNRYQEALQALCEVGVPPDDAISLGFPDDGIDDLLKEHYSPQRPYTSPHTRFSRVGYKESFKRWVVYAGVNLKDEMAKILLDFSPDWIVLPDPRDYHPDHCATGIFVLEALRQLNQQGEVVFSNLEILTYLVHFKDYPTSPNWEQEVRKSGLFMSTTGCATLSSTEWLELSLTAEDLESKERALTAHQSQHQMLGGFFKIFQTEQEIFGRLAPAQALAIPQEYALFFKQPNS